MFNSLKSSAPEKDKNVAATAAEIMGSTVQPHDQEFGHVSSFLPAVAEPVV